ncbi:hypothetical protein [Paraburkholderia sacchari]|uniref:hypothetical protein n=1 Tax=Paraburkholderia sacchari TaxID=159450 RepID=UPI003D994886
MKIEQEKLNEINQRVTRLESRLVQLGDHVGANLRTKMRIVLHKDEHGVWVDVDALDVSMSRILNELQRLGVEKDTHLPVKCNGGTIGSVVAR